MKISKEKLLESVALKEDDAPEATEPEVQVDENAGGGVEDVGNASTEEIKQDIIASSAEVGVEVPEKAAENYAKEIETEAAALNAKAIEYAAVNSANPNDIINKLNACLETGLERWSNAKTLGDSAVVNDKVSNLLIYGMPGFGKTAAVKAWCRAMGIYLLEIKCSTLSKETISGIPWPVLDEKTGRYVQKNVEAETWTPLFHHDKVVLFLDEINTSKADIEPTLYGIVADHELPMISTDKNGVTLTQTPFNNILFCVAAMNPPDPQLFGKATRDLGDAINSRFNFQHEQNGDRKEFQRILKSIYNAILANPNLGPDKKYKYEGQYRIGETLMKDKNFFFWGWRETKDAYLDAAKDQKYVKPHSVNYRELAQLLYGCNGTKADFLKKAAWAGFTPAAIRMFETALATYVDKPKQSNTIFGGQKIDPKIENAAAEEIDDLMGDLIKSFSV